MPQADLEVIGIVRRRDLDGASSELRIGPFIGYDGDLAIHQRKKQLLTVQMGIARILGMDRYRHVTQHGFWTSGGHRQRLPAVPAYWIAHVVQLARKLLVRHFQ